VSNRRVFIYLATYPGEAEALADYGALMDLHESRIVTSYDVALVTKDAEGRVHVDKHEKPTQHGAWSGLLAGALVGVLFPPSVVVVGGAAAAGALIGGLGGHFLEGLSRGDARDLGDLLADGQAALVVIGDASAQTDLDKALTRAEKTIERSIEADRGQLTHELEQAEAQLAAESAAASSSPGAHS